MLGEEWGEGLWNRMTTQVRGENTPNCFRGNEGERRTVPARDPRPAAECEFTFSRSEMQIFQVSLGTDVVKSTGSYRSKRVLTQEC